MMVVVSSGGSFSAEKSQEHNFKSCCLHFLATSLDTPAQTMAVRKAVSRVPVAEQSYQQLAIYSYSYSYIK